MATEDGGGRRRTELDLRASDTDRERVADRLRSAAGHGRISLDELEERLEAVYAAKTYGELVPITGDLPAEDEGYAPPADLVPTAAAAASPLVGGQPTGGSTAIAIMSGANRTGRWVLPRRLRVFAFWGGSVIDLREAGYESARCTIRATAIMGGVQIIAPDDVDVQVTGIGIMGGVGANRSAADPKPGAPVVHVRAFAFWGGVGVRRVPRTAPAELEG